MSDQSFNISVNVIMGVVFILIILYMLFSIPVQKIYQKPHIIQPDGFNNYNKAFV